MFLVLPFAFLAKGIIHEGQHLALIIASVAVVGSYLRNKWLASFSWYLCLWVVFILVYSMIYPLNGSVVAAALDRLIYFFAGFALFIGVTLSRIPNRRFYDAIRIATIIQMGLSLSQFCGFDPIKSILELMTGTRQLIEPRALTGTLGNNNFLAAFVAISLPFFFRAEERVFMFKPRWYIRQENWGRTIPFRIDWRFFLIPAALVLILSITSSAFIPAIIGTAVYFWPKLSRDKRNFLIYWAAALSFTYAFVYHPSLRISPRWVDWGNVIAIIMPHPLAATFGMGPGAYWGKPYPMHNEWLECFYQFGVIGFGIMAGYAANIFRGNRLLFSAFLIAAINMFGNYSLHLAPSAFLIILIAGLIERERIVRNG
jgi:hypothetical protein